MRNNRRLISSLMIMVVLTATLVSVAQASDYQGTVEIDCSSADAAGTGPHILDRDNTGSGQESLRVVVYDGAGTIIYELFFSNVLGSFAGGLGDFFYTTPPQYDPITFQLWSLAGNGFDLQLDFEATGSCSSLPIWQGESEAAAPVPGCDVLLPIPSTAVGGSFVANAPVYWEPGELTDPQVTIPAGNSARVIGQDASGQYYKIIWVCDFVWVSKATMGPNYDQVWNGAPLPTGVVE